MRRALPFLTVLPLALLASGCVYALRTASQPTDVKLRVQSSQPQQHVVRVTLDSPADYPVGSDGRVQFTVPRFSSGCDVYVSDSSRRATDQPKAFALLSCAETLGSFAGFHSLRFQSYRGTIPGSASSEL